MSSGSSSLRSGTSTNSASSCDKVESTMRAVIVLRTGRKFGLARIKVFGRRIALFFAHSENNTRQNLSAMILHADECMTRTTTLESSNPSETCENCYNKELSLLLANLTKRTLQQHLRSPQPNAVDIAAMSVTNNLIPLNSFPLSNVLPQEIIPL